MGGCRCFFRNCKVNTYKHPGMHFFRYPLNDPKRCALWVEYSQQLNLYSLAPGRQKNMVICSRHFRDECFMNYLKNRLVATAVPTIHRLSKDKALDYELEMVNGVLVTLPEPTETHLIPSAGFECPLGFSSDSEVSKLLRNLENERAIDHSTDIYENEVPSSSQSNVEILSLVGSYSDEVPSNEGAITETTGKIAPDQVARKRSANSLFLEESSATEQPPLTKRRNKNFTDSAITISEEPVLSTDNFEFNCQPTIINHQILDPEARIWLKSDSFNIEDNDDPNYEFVQVQSQTGSSQIGQVVEIVESSQDDVPEDNDECFTDNVHISLQLDANSAEMESLRSKLNDEIEKCTDLEKNLSASQMAYTRSEQQVGSLKADLELLKNENNILKTKCMEIEKLKEQLENEKRESQKVATNLTASKEEYSRIQKQMNSLKNQLTRFKNENNTLKKDLQNSKISNETEAALKQQLQETHKDQNKHSQFEQQLQQQISTLEQSLELVRQQLSDAKSSLNSVKSDYAKVQGEKMNLIKQQVETEQKLQTLQEMYDATDLNYTMLEKNHEILQKSNAKLKADYQILEKQQNQVSTITTSNSYGASLPIMSQQPATVPLTKAQLFNGIKRYISSSMCSLLRMEMFGSSEREWKSDERQVAVDLLRLGESVYKYMTDEWRFRLPALRDVRNWLSQSVNIDDEEDL